VQTINSDAATNTSGFLKWSDMIRFTSVALIRRLVATPEIRDQASAKQGHRDVNTDQE